MKHEGLAEQLWTYIQNPSFNIVARRLALEIAEDCRVEELNDRLLGVVCDATWDQQVREGAARTLHKTLPSHRVEALERLGRGECEPDPDDEIKAHALYRLVPAVWSLAAALQYLTPPKNDHFHGTYYMFLHYEAPNRISVEDLSFVLPWLINIEHCFDILNPFSGLASRALTLALQNLQQLEIRQAIVCLLRPQRLDAIRSAEEADVAIAQAVDGNRKVHTPLKYPGTPRSDSSALNLRAIEGEWRSRQSGRLPLLTEWQS